MRKIILSADDFGRSPSRNRAIDYCLRNGLISSAALLVNSKYTSEAINMAFDGGYVDKLHCHFNFYPGEVSGFSKPLCHEYLNNPLLSIDGEYRILNRFPPLRLSKKVIGIVEKEMENQYELFGKLTRGKGCLKHIDFHLYSNLSWPVSGAVRLFTERNPITTARYVGGRRILTRSFLSRMKRKVILSISKSNKIVTYPSYQADQFILLWHDVFSKSEIVEVYVHPDCVNGIIVDNTKPANTNGVILSMENTFHMLQRTNVEILGWNDI